MFTVDKTKLRQVLKERENLSSVSINSLINHYPDQLDDIFRLSFEAWINENSFIDVSVDGIKLSEVINIKPTIYPVAVRMLSKLCDSDLSTADRDQWHRILTQTDFIE